MRPSLFSYCSDGYQCTPLLHTAFGYTAISLLPVSECLFLLMLVFFVYQSPLCSIVNIYCPLK